MDKRLSPPVGQKIGQRLHQVALMRRFRMPELDALIHRRRLSWLGRVARLPQLSLQRLILDACVPYPHHNSCMRSLSGYLCHTILISKLLEFTRFNGSIWQTTNSTGTRASIY
jgi:hypothetical protein